MPSDSPYVESRVDLFDKRETVELAERLGVSVVTAVGHLHALWHHVRRSGSLDGDLSRLGPEELAQAARWPGDPAQLQDALLEGEWLDRTGTVHNWVLYYGHEGESKAAATERQRRRRAAVRGFTEEQLWSRDGGKCRYCGSSVTLRTMSVALIVGSSRTGGDLSMANSVTACRSCCKRKSGLHRVDGSLPIMGLLDDVPSSVTRDSAGHLSSITRDSAGLVSHLSSVTRDSAGSSVTRDIAPVYGNGHEPSELSTLTRDSAGSSVTRDSAGITPGLTGAKVNAVLFSPEAEKVNAVAFSESGEVNAVQFSDADQKVNSVHFSPDEPAAQQTAQGSSVTRDSAADVAKTPERVNTGTVLTGSLTGDLTGDALTLNQGVQGDGEQEPEPTPKKRGGKREPKPERVQAAERLYGVFKELINPGARSCPVDKILRRLERFSEDEIMLAIRKFSADAWWSTHCDDKPASWFFRSDDQIEKFLIMRVRPKAGAEQSSWLAQLENDQHLIRRRTLDHDDDSHTPPARPEDQPMIATATETQEASDVAF